MHRVSLGKAREAYAPLSQSSASALGACTHTSRRVHASCEPRQGTRLHQSAPLPEPSSAQRPPL